MATPTLTDVSAFRFKDMDLSGALVSWNDRFGMRLAGHQYLKRDGAEQEPMGAEPGRFTVRLCFLGASWAKQYRALVASIRKDPRGQMVHPIFGTLQVACEGIQDAAVVPAAELDAINISASFVEDAIDATIVADAFVGPAAHQGRVSNLAASLITAISGYAALVAQAAALTAAAVSFAVDAVAASSNDQPDPSLDGQLAALGTSTQGLISAVLASPQSTSDATAYPVLDAIEQLYAECLALADAVAASKPTIVTYVVTGDTTLPTLAATLYGKDGRSRMDEIATLNRIPDPFRIRAGTTLRVAAATI
jgi:prophage DNA circulation protein